MGMLHFPRGRAQQAAVAAGGTVLAAGARRAGFDGQVRVVDLLRRFHVTWVQQLALHSREYSIRQLQLCR